MSKNNISLYLYSSGDLDDVDDDDDDGEKPLTIDEGDEEEEEDERGSQRKRKRRRGGNESAKKRRKASAPPSSASAAPQSGAKNVCAVCSRSFATPPELRRHFRGHGMAYLSYMHSSPSNLTDVRLT